MHREHSGELSGTGDDLCPPVIAQLAGAGPEGAGHRAVDRPEVKKSFSKLRVAAGRGADPTRIDVDLAHS